MSGNDKIVASDDDWSALLDFGNLDTDLQDDDLDDVLLAPSEELGRVSRKIAAQYAEVIASFAATAFRGNADASTEQVEAAIDAMARLAEASNLTRQSDLLDEARALVKPAVTGAPSSRPRQRALIGLREWIPRFCETLEPTDAERLSKVVSWDAGSHPLMAQLAEVRGIGPKRLQRLYAAGLYTVEVVATADPKEVAAVTGLPLTLATKVVDFTRQYAVDERKRCIETLRERAIRLRHMLRSVPDSDNSILDLADEAIREVEMAFHELHARRGK